MKKGKLLLLLFVCFLAIPCIHASSASTYISGTNSIKVGNTTQIYIGLNSSAAIEGVDVSYSTSGNIAVTNVQVGSGLTSVYNANGRYALYAQTPIRSGSTVLILTVKGTAEGRGTVYVTGMEATVSGETAIANTASYNITVNPLKTQAEIQAEQIAQQQKAEADKKAAEERAKKDAEAKKKAAEEKKKAEAEKAKKEAEAKKNLKEVTKLVEKAESTLAEQDYKTALNKVKGLPDSTSKTDLLNRLEEVEFKIAVNNQCGKKTECEVCEKVDNETKPWIILSLSLIHI